MKLNILLYKPLAEHNPLQRITLLVLCLLLILGIGLSSPLPTAAQEEDGWADPLNLSRSGAATDPHIVADTQGWLHVIWEDDFLGWVYTRFNGETWSNPVVVDFPFEPENLKFASDGRGRIHAFWMDQEGRVYHSRVSPGSFSDPEAWTEIQVAASSALTYKIVGDERGEIHLAFIRPLQTEGSPAGVYYRRTAGSGDSWTSPYNLYQSPYFRGLSRSDANVDLAAVLIEAEMRVYITWDNCHRKEVLLTVSRDGGDSWAEPVVIDMPDPERGLATPFNLNAGAKGEGVMLIWQVGEPGSSCRQYYQWSPDGGISWSEPLAMLAQSFSCPGDNRFIPSGDGNLVLMSTILDSVYLSAWDGERWSDPQNQGVLRSFDHPDVLTQVRLGCL
ncbi:MAG: hypothetical protein IBX69_18595, partial [Anaerolineales bacterium]|nr:hypothetical protein [Anaerolineales bacterium]